jgi:hypothetical protein
MKKQIIIAVLLCGMAGVGLAQFGIGAGGGIIYPGFSKSEVSGSQFGLGVGFDVLIRHTLLKLSDSLTIDARYSYRHYVADISLPRVLTTRFKFSYLSIAVSTDFYSVSSLDLYGGIGASLCTTNAIKDFLEVTETVMLPEVLIGIEYELSRYYNLYSEMDFQFGEIRVRDDNLSLNGFRWIIGATMFLTE